MDKRILLRRKKVVHEQKMKENGWYILMTPASHYDGIHANYSTKGLTETFKHKELQITLNVHPNIAAGILHTLVGHIKEGQIYQAGNTYELLDGYTVLFKEVKFSEIQLLRVILPDENGSFTADPIYKSQLDDYNFDVSEEGKGNP